VLCGGASNGVGMSANKWYWLHHDHIGVCPNVLLLIRQQAQKLVQVAIEEVCIFKLSHLDNKFKIPILFIPYSKLFYLLSFC
jgi:hypothetical protein